MKHSIKAYIVGNEIDGYRVLCRQFTKLLFEAPFQELKDAQKFLNGLEGVTIKKAHSLIEK